MKKGIRSKLDEEGNIQAQAEDCLGKTLRKTTSVIWSEVFFISCDLIQKYFGQRESKKVVSFGSAFRVRAI